MGNLVVAPRETAIFSRNLLNKLSLFEEPLTWVSSGISAVNSDLLPYDGYKGGIKFTYLTDENETVIYPNPDIEVTIPKTGLHLFAFRVYKPDPSAETYIKLKVSINGIVTTATTYTFALLFDEGYVEGRWNTLFQTLLLTEDDVVSYSFESQSLSIGSTLYLGGFKLEHVDRNIPTPSIYSRPLDTVLEVSQMIDIPSISSNASYTIVQELIGAKDNDFVEVSIPSNVGNSGLIFSQPYVSDDDEVSMVVHNHTGGAINPDNGFFKFKIVK